MNPGAMKWRWTLIILIVTFGLVSILPNFVKLPEGWVFGNKTLVYGLDIQGGLHLVMGVDVDEVVREQMGSTAISLKDYFEDQKVNVSEVERVQDGNRYKIKIVAADPSSAQQVKQKIQTDWPNYLTTEVDSTTIELRQNDLAHNDLEKRTIEQAIETIRNRIDEFGVAEPSITAQGSDRILIQLPGIEDSTKAKELINRTARLEFMLVDADTDLGKLNEWIKEAEKAEGFALKGMTYREYSSKVNTVLKDKLKEDQTILFERAPNAEDMETGKVPYVLNKVGIGGDDLRDAFVSYDEFNNPEVSLTFTTTGASKFADVTGKNIGKQLAIILDDVVYSAPNIQSRIPDGRARITLGRGRDMESLLDEARTISMALRAGALPARLEQLEERTVGPTLGADSIAKGEKAIAIGGALVLLFMLVYYKIFGLLANLALTLNMMLIMAVLTSLEATLTLPGIAGIALTIGMAVDANVIVFERIKEELSKGAHMSAAIREGYAKAFSAIFDANITTAATSIILMYFGTGPVRGFAVTLLIGIVTSLFTAVFVTRTVLELMVGKMKMNRVSI